MDQTEKKRKLILGGALIATLVAVVLVEEEDEDTATGIVETVQPVKTVSSSRDRARNQESNTELLDVGKLGQRKFNPLAGELFASTSWMPKQPQISLEEQIALAEQVKKAAPKPPAPTAPPLQFKYNGKAVTDDETWVFLSQSGEHHITKVGGKINSQYRLDSINDSTVTVTYLPLNVKQTLTINNKIAGTFR